MDRMSNEDGKQEREEDIVQKRDGFMPGRSMNMMLLSIQAGYQGGKKSKLSLRIEPRSLACRQ